MASRFQSARKFTECDDASDGVPMFSSRRKTKMTDMRTQPLAHPTIFKQPDVPPQAFRSWEQVLGRYVKIARGHGVCKRLRPSECGQFQNPARQQMCCVASKLDLTVQKDLSKLVTREDLCLSVQNETEPAPMAPSDYQELEDAYAELLPKKSTSFVREAVRAAVRVTSRIDFYMAAIFCAQAYAAPSGQESSEADSTAQQSRSLGEMSHGQFWFLHVAAGYGKSRSSLFSNV